MSFHESPSFDEPKSLPFFVPKKILSPTLATASRRMTSYAFFYPPKNQDYATPSGERPPLIVMSHGGPTAAAS